MPSGLSPSSMELWHQCPRRFEQEKINRRPSDTGIPAVTGTLVHRALEFLLELPPQKRTQKAAYEALTKAWPETKEGADVAKLGLNEDDLLLMRRAAVASMRTYFDIEKPHDVKVVATERKLGVIIQPDTLEATPMEEAFPERAKPGDAPKPEVTEIDGVPLRGIIDRLDRDGRGNLVVTDYKNGKVPAPMFQGPKLRQLNIYGALVEAVDGEMPTIGRLVFTAYGKEIRTSITRRTVDSAKEEAVEVWSEVGEAFETGNFTPITGPLCGWCPFAAECPEGIADLRERRAAGKLKKAAPNYDLAAPVEDPDEVAAYESQISNV